MTTREFEKMRSSSFLEERECYLFSFSSFLFGTTGHSLGVLGYWLLGSSWAILSLQAFILEVLELWVFGNL